MKVLDYILTVQKGSIAASFISLLGILILIFTVNPMENKIWLFLGFGLLLTFLSTFLILLSFFWSFSVRRAMIGIKQVNLLVTRSVVVSMSVVVYLAALVTGQDNLYIIVFLVLFLAFYLFYSYQLD